MSLQLTGLARVYNLMLDQAVAMGLDRAELMRVAGLTEPELTDPDARIELSKLWGLWRALIERTDDPYLGLHIGGLVRLHQYGLVGYVLANSATLRDALTRLCRYSRIVVEGLVMHFEDASGQARIVIERSARFDDLRHPTDSRLSGVVAAARELTGRDIIPLEVCFPHEAPVEASEYQRIFRGPVRFERPRAEVVFSDADLARPVVTADVSLGSYLDQHAESVLRSLGGHATLTTRVRRAIWDELSGGQPGLQQVASTLGVSARTLQRKLHEEGTSFGAQLDDLRQEMAVRLLRDRALAIYEVAFLLGYSEPSTFHRAFRRWRGMAPHVFRRTLGTGQPTDGPATLH